MTGTHPRAQKGDIHVHDWCTHRQTRDGCLALARCPPIDWTKPSVRWLESSVDVDDTSVDSLLGYCTLCLASTPVPVQPCMRIPSTRLSLTRSSGDRRYPIWSRTALPDATFPPLHPLSFFTHAHVSPLPIQDHGPKKGKIAT